MAMTRAERDELVAEIAAAVRTRAGDSGLTDDEQRWVRMAIQREAQSIELLLTTRLQRYVGGSGTGWRKAVATWVCDTLLDPLDPRGEHC